MDLVLQLGTGLVSLGADAGGSLPAENRLQPSAGVMVFPEPEYFVPAYQLAVPVIANIRHHPLKTRPGPGPLQSCPDHPGIGDHGLELVF